MNDAEKLAVLDPSDVSAIIQMALSDHVPFDTIKIEYGLSEKEVQALMRRELKAGSYRTWRKRVHTFGTRRAQYK
jgi:uncharacterized protein (TIGR03643 family)